MGDTSRRSVTQFAQGQSGNPAGRPKGARNKLQEAFISDLHADWQENGKAALEAMRAEKPNEYVRVVAGLIPAKVEVERPLGELSDSDLASVLDAVRALIGHAEADGAGSGSRIEAPPLGTALN